MKSLNRYGQAPLLAAAAIAAFLAAGCHQKIKTAREPIIGISGVNTAEASGIDMPQTPGTGVSAAFGALTDPRDGKTYRTAAIGDRTWMAENLNYAPESGNSWCYRNNKDSCGKYGRLYDYAAARTVCPAGWHLPTASEWDELTGWVNFVAGGNSAKMLAAASGWDKNRENLVGAEDGYGFSALPGGLRNSEGEFYNAGYTGNWWTATEADGNRAYERVISYDEDTVASSGRHKKSGYSVRCVIDENEGVAYSLTLSPANGGSATAYPRKASYNAGKLVTITATPKNGYIFDKWTGGRTANDTSATTTLTMDSNITLAAEFRPVAYGTLTDRRDGRTYKTVKMPDGMAWMAENLNYAPPDGKGWSYGNHTSYSDKYGRLYDWETANTACPNGWRLPTRKEWDKLGKAVGGKPIKDKNGNINWRGAGKKLKATSGWGERKKHRNIGNRNGTDDYGFSALSGGYLCGVDCYGGGYHGAGDHALSTEFGSWWTATDMGNGSRKAIYRRIFLESADAVENDSYKSDGHSVRCVTDGEKFVSATGAATYSLTLEAGEGGSVSADPVKTVYAAGETVSVSAAPNCGFAFAEWMGGEIADAASPATAVTVNSNTTVAARFTRVTPYLARGAFTDKRDGKTYKTVQVCEDVWMAENLNYKTEDVMRCGDTGTKGKNRNYENEDDYEYEYEEHGGERNGRYGDVGTKGKNRNYENDDDAEYEYEERGGKRNDGKDSDCKIYGSRCYDGKESNCKKYGRLYDWETAAKACPAGWHLASAEEWEALVGHADGWEKREVSEWGIGGDRLKAKSGWKKYEGYKEDRGGNGTDDFGFSALPGGAYNPNKDEDDDDDYIKAGEFGGWWSIGGKNAPVLQVIRHSRNSVDTRDLGGELSASARCVSDKAGHVPAPTALTLTLIAGKGGSVSAVPNKKSYIAGERVTVSAVPNRGYAFVKWTGGKVADSGYAVAMVTVASNMAITADFSNRGARPVAYGSFTDARDGKKYETVTIGGKAWMAQNLNYRTPDSSWCYGDSAGGCDKYGRLYAWNAAKTACPAGWHLPDVEEWDGLVKTAGGKKAAGAKLKATSGWTFFGSGWVRTGNGADYYGFAALPGGARRSNGYFDHIGEYGYWWTATEDKKDAENAYIRKMEENNGDVTQGYYGENEKNCGLSVRCVIDEAAPYSLTLAAATGGSVSAVPAKASYRAGERVSITAVPEKGHTFAGWTGGRPANAGYAATTVTMDSSMAIAAAFNKSGAAPIAYGTLVDARDGIRYKTTVIGGKTWMAENLNYQTSEKSWCYENKTDNCVKYGRLYDWTSAKAACPDGWHLPTRYEWNELIAAAGGDKAADKNLKSVSGWSKAGNGTDVYGFSALPGGSYDDHDIKYEDAGNEGYWWTATEAERMRRIAAYGRTMTSDSGKALEHTYRKNAGASARCVMDEDGALTLIAATGGTASVSPRKASYKAGEKISITAVPDSGYAFADWSGGSVANVYTATAAVVMNANMAITANFRRVISGKLSDKRDGKAYKTVKIGRDTWMAENLNYKPPKDSSWCYEDDTSFCDKYGRLYDWGTAIKACPAGWHLPSRAEWDSLAATAGGWYYCSPGNSEYGTTWYEAGTRLKSQAGWAASCCGDDANTDNFGFSALPGGCRYNAGGAGGKYKYLGSRNRGYWWSSGQRNKSRAFLREMNHDVLSENGNDKGEGHSVRCVMDKK